MSGYVAGGATRAPTACLCAASATWAASLWPRCARLAATAHFGPALRACSSRRQTSRRADARCGGPIEGLPPRWYDSTTRRRPAGGAAMLAADDGTMRPARRHGGLGARGSRSSRVRRERGRTADGERVPLASIRPRFCATSSRGAWTWPPAARGCASYDAKAARCARYVAGVSDEGADRVPVRGFGDGRHHCGRAVQDSQQPRQSGRRCRPTRRQDGRRARRARRALRRPIEGLPLRWYDSTTRRRPAAAAMLAADDGTRGTRRAPATTTPAQRRSPRQRSPASGAPPPPTRRMRTRCSVSDRAAAGGCVAPRSSRTSSRSGSASSLPAPPKKKMRKLVETPARFELPDCRRLHIFAVARRRRASSRARRARSDAEPTPSRRRARHRRRPPPLPPLPPQGAPRPPPATATSAGRPRPVTVPPPTFVADGGVALHHRSRCSTATRRGTSPQNWAPQLEAIGRRDRVFGDGHCAHVVRRRRRPPYSSSSCSRPVRARPATRTTSS